MSKRAVSDKLKATLRIEQAEEKVRAAQSVFSPLPSPVPVSDAQVPLSLKDSAQRQCAVLLSTSTVLLDACCL